jgi:small subunit ribosomal protein S8
MYYRILPELKNAVLARKERVTFPFSKMDLAVLMALKEGGYIKSAEKEMAGRRNVIVVRLPSRDKALNDFKLISKPSRHFYADYRSIRAVKQGHGLGVFSTSKGIMTNKQAQKAKLGGEYLFEVW